MRATYEKVPARPDASFVAKRLDLPAFPFAWHFHSEYELTLITSGRGQRFVGDHIGDFREGDLVLLGPDLPHTWYSGPRNPAARCRAIVVQFGRGFLGEGFWDRPEMRRVRTLLDESAVGLQFTNLKTLAITERLKRLPGYRPLNRLTTLLETLDALAQESRRRPLSGPKFEPHLRTADRRRMDLVSEFIDRRYADPIGVADAAAATELSESAFARLFRRATGKRFVQYLNEVRIGAACRRLTDTDQTVAHIALASGFGNLSNFNRRFLAVKGMTPTRFRRAHPEQ